MTIEQEDDALTDGRWVVRRAVRHWQPNPDPRTGVDTETPPDPEPSTPLCGTEQGYQHHRYQARKAGTPWPLPLNDPCQCRAAHRVSERLRVAARRPEQAQHAVHHYEERSA